MYGRCHKKDKVDGGSCVCRVTQVGVMSNMPSHTSRCHEQDGSIQDASCKGIGLLMLARINLQVDAHPIDLVWCNGSSMMRLNAW